MEVAGVEVPPDVAEKLRQIAKADGLSTNRLLYETMRATVESLEAIEEGESDVSPRLKRWLNNEAKEQGVSPTKLVSDALKDRAASPAPTSYADDKDWYRMEYQEIGKSYLALRDFRAKLLGFLPLASSGVFLLLSQRGTSQDAKVLCPIGLYGVCVTVGLYLYERGVMQQLRDLIVRGRVLEEKVGVGRGQFTARDERRVERGIRSPVAAAWIYGATGAAWLGLAGYGLWLLLSHQI